MSRNNDVYGYWGIGVLRLFAEKSGLSIVTVYLLNGLQNFELGTPVPVVEEKYKKWLRDALNRANIDIQQVKTAKIELRFSTFDEFPNIVRDTRGSPYVCTVKIERKNGHIYSATKVGCCEAHNPEKEAKSGRSHLN